MSEEGVALAKKLSKLRQVNTLDIVYTSLQTKALETAVLATKNTGIPIKTDTRLTETTSFTNKFVSLEQLQENTKKYYSNTNVSINNGETQEEALSRFNEALRDITKLKDKDNIGIVSHGNILASFSTQYIHMDALELIVRIKQPDIAIFNWETKQFTNFFGEIFI